MKLLRNWLRKFLSLKAAHEPEWVATGSRQPIKGSYQNISSATLAAATKITIPTQTVNRPAGAAVDVETLPVTCGYAIIQNNGTASVRWTDDGTTPTAAVGMLLIAGAELDYAGDIAAWQAIEVAGGATLDITLYR